MYFSPNFFLMSQILWIRYCFTTILMVSILCVTVILESFYFRLNFLAHTLVQMRGAPSMLRGGYDDPNKLSFVQQSYT